MKTLVRLRAKRPRKAYKSNESYLRAVFDRNKKWLELKATYTPTRATLRQSFVLEAMNYVKKGKSAVQAANMVASSASFAGKGYRGKINIYNVIMNDKKLYKKFKEEARLKKKADFDVEKIQWRYVDNGYYIYEDVIIDVSNSPFRITIRRKGKGLEKISDSIL